MLIAEPTPIQIPAGWFFSWPSRAEWAATRSDTLDLRARNQEVTDSLNYRLRLK
jgi:hypothetical protein